MTDKTLTVGLEGCMIHTENMGCAALTWSLLSMLERIAGETQMSFRYRVFEDLPDKRATGLMTSGLRMDPGQLAAVKTTSLFHPLAELRHPRLTQRAYAAMKECDLFIDLTQGDSLTDIYGPWRFRGFTRIKEKILSMDRPLILGPQTYGPFLKERNARRAARVLKKARCVLARDTASAQAAKALCGREVPALTDLAFALPWTEQEKPASGRIRVGVNASSLLVQNRTEPTDVRFALKADYDEYLRLILTRLTRDSRCEVFLIPHVGQDAGPLFREAFPDARVLPPFDSPVRAREAVARMDLLIGARMHAVISALSAGTAVIPTAYSPKFTGLLKSLSYPYLVDLTRFSAQEAADQTMELMNQRGALREAARESGQIAARAVRETEAILREQILLAASGGGKDTQ